jgi:dTDP-glucose 4,6-dehydratase
MDKSEKMIEYVNDRLGHDLRYAIDFSKAKRELAWEPQINFSDGLAQTVAWYQENESWWRPLKNDDVKIHK